MRCKFVEKILSQFCEFGTPTVDAFARKKALVLSVGGDPVVGGARMPCSNLWARNFCGSIRLFKAATGS